jgi:hypothetical protein
VSTRSLLYGTVLLLPGELVFKAAWYTLVVSAHNHLASFVHWMHAAAYPRLLRFLSELELSAV